MDINNLSSIYKTKLLNKDNVQEILNLYLSNPEYFKYCPPSPSIETVIDDLNDLPPNMGYDDKHFIGFYDNDKLMGVLELITNYPDKETCFIGLFMLESSYQNRGIGSSMVEEICLYLKQIDYHKIRLAYVVGNSKAENFWHRNGFVTIKQTKSLNAISLDVMVAVKQL